MTKRKKSRKPGRTIEGYHGHSDIERIARLLSEVMTESHLGSHREAEVEIVQGLQRYAEQMGAESLEQTTGAPSEWIERELVAEDRYYSTLYGLFDDLADKMRKADDKLRREYDKIERAKRAHRSAYKRARKGKAVAGKAASLARRAALRRAMRGA